MVVTVSCSATDSGTIEDLVANGRAIAQLRAQVDGRPQCLRLIGGVWPIAFNGDYLYSDSVDALIVAGLFRRQRMRVLDGDRPRTELIAKPVIRDVIKLEKDTRSPLLCLGRMHVTAVHALVSRPTHSSMPTLRYRYRLINMPAWAQDSALRKAFPFLATLSTSELTASLMGTLSEGKISVFGHPELALPTELPNAGFDSCSPRPKADEPQCV